MNDCNNFIEVMFLSDYVRCIDQHIGDMNCKIVIVTLQSASKSLTS